MRTIRFEEAWWLILDEGFRPRYLVHHAAAVHGVTGETHILYRVEKWQLERAKRRVVYWGDTLAEVEEWCRVDMAEPSPDGYWHGPAATGPRRSSGEG